MTLEPSLVPGAGHCLIAACVGIISVVMKTWSEPMRYVNGVFCVALTLFAIAQYNDPDALVWFLIYAIPAAWAGMVAFRPHLLPASRPAVALFVACLAAAVAGCIYMWPTLAAGWIDVEEEREGIGLIIATVGLMAAGWTWWRQERGWSPEHAAPR